jgi:hypothetical protein
MHQTPPAPWARHLRRCRPGGTPAWCACSTARHSCPLALVPAVVNDGAACQPVAWPAGHSGVPDLLSHTTRRLTPATLPWQVWGVFGGYSFYDHMASLRLFPLERIVWWTTFFWSHAVRT